jgi:hypothetical protein
VFTRALHWLLSWTTWIQCLPPHLVSVRSILILSSHLCLGFPSGLFLSGLRTKKNLHAFLFCPIRATCLAHLIVLDLIILIILQIYFDYIGRRVQVMKLLIMQFYLASSVFIRLGFTCAPVIVVKWATYEYV